MWVNPATNSLRTGNFTKFSVFLDDFSAGRPKSRKGIEKLARDSLFFAEQRISTVGTGTFSPKQGIKQRIFI
jgi:hypothetical protein